jgi:hypothetical protein
MKKPVLYTATFVGGSLDGQRFSVEQGQRVVESVEITPAGDVIKHIYHLVSNTTNFEYKGTGVINNE